MRAEKGEHSHGNDLRLCWREGILVGKIAGIEIKSESQVPLLSLLITGYKFGAVIGKTTPVIIHLFTRIIC